MLQRFICILSATIALCYALTERTDFVTTSELAKDYTEDKLLTSIIRARNSSKIPYLKGNNSEEHEKSSEKQPRTAIHRVESDSRDKWNIIQNSVASRDACIAKISNLQVPVAVVPDTDPTDRRDLNPTRIESLGMAIATRPNMASVYQSIGSPTFLKLQN